MPSATDELRAAFPGSSDQAIAELQAAGFILTNQWTWIVPIGHMPTQRELDAMTYLVQEWDFGWIEKDAVSLVPRKAQP